MPCDECQRERVNTLLSGDTCCTMCDRHRRECEARDVLSIPSTQGRRDYLYGTENNVNGYFRKGVLKQRGSVAVNQLEQDIMKQWKFNKESK